MCDPVNPTDDELVASALAGRSTALADLVRRHAGKVFRVALRLTGNAADAEDVLQETFLQVHRRLETFRNEAKFSTWLYGIATNAALMHRRARRSRPVESPIEEYLPAFDATGTYCRLDMDYSCATWRSWIRRRQRGSSASRPRWSGSGFTGRA
jgi:DNA-directed RNA polymerase specialized sigma24 family protein